MKMEGSGIINYRVFHIRAKKFAVPYSIPMLTYTVTIWMSDIIANLDAMTRPATAELNHKLIALFSSLRQCNVGLIVTALTCENLNNSCMYTINTHIMELTCSVNQHWAPFYKILWIFAIFLVPRAQYHSRARTYTWRVCGVFKIETESAIIEKSDMIATPYQVQSRNLRYSSTRIRFVSMRAAGSLNRQQHYTAEYEKMTELLSSWLDWSTTRMQIISSL